VRRKISGYSACKHICIPKSILQEESLTLPLTFQLQSLQQHRSPIEFSCLLLKLLEHFLRMAAVSEPKRKVKEFSPELVWVTDQDRKDFVLAMEVDTNKKCKHFGLDQLVAQ
jgi:hypothetical protein